ncbi:unnamed protein product [Owenia fusiformis]|uniref:Uncharacterized protein n=1 Tax=Owenia fusiformis TaxID=6347 RepID=A0A8J1UI66_OWEFU|nr:unnamed protein product [Owenia fusiformis]
MKFSKLRKNKEKQMAQQDKEKSRFKMKQIDDDYNVDLDNDENDSDVSVSEDVVNEVPVVTRPFSGNKKDVDESGSLKYASWRCPGVYKPERVKDFEFEKPEPQFSSASFTSPAQQVLRLGKVIEQKEKDIDYLRDALFKSQRENYKLCKQIEGYSGKDYDSLKKENLILKEQLTRVMRENARLHGEKYKDTNHIFHKLKIEEKLEEQYGVKNKNIPKPKIAKTLYDEDTVNLENTRNLNSSKDGSNSSIDNLNTSHRSNTSPGNRSKNISGLK